MNETKYLIIRITNSNQLANGERTILKTKIKNFNYKKVRIPGDTSNSIFTVTAAICFRPNDLGTGGHYTCFSRNFRGNNWHNISDNIKTNAKIFLQNLQGVYLLYLTKN